MATLILIRLDCKTTEDWGEDEIKIVVNDSAAWNGDINDGQQKDLGNKAVKFTGNATIKLFEEDWPDGDDHLGTVTVNDQNTVAASRAARFTGDEADYTLWYSVYSDVPPPSPPHAPPGPPTPADPADPKPKPSGGGGAGDPKVPCQLCHLIVEVRDPVPSKPVQGAGVRVLMRGLQGVTGADGRVDFGPVLPGSIQVEAWKDHYFPFPATLGASVGGGGEAGPTVLTMYLSQAQVVEVTPLEQRWYVNMDADESKRHGRDVTIKARISTKTPGIRVHFTLDADPANRAGLPEAQKAQLQGKNALTDSEGVATIKLKLGTYGGDRYRVSASLNPNTAPGAAGAKESGWLTVWRKAFYEITQMQKPGGVGYWEMDPGAMGHVKTAFEKVFLEIVSLGAARNIDENVQNFLTADLAYQWADKHTTMTGVPWKIHYVVVGYACGREEKDVEANVNTATAEVGPGFRPYDFDGTNPIKSAQYKPAAGAGSWTNFPAGKVTLTGTNPNKKVRVDFSGTGVDPTAAAQKVKVSYIEANPANGWGGSSLHLIICRGTFNEYYAGMNLGPIMAGTSIHEPGHSLDLVFSQDWETSDAAHSDHCKFRTCVMWWQGYSGRPHDFHPPATGDPGCHTYMRGLDMSRSAIEKKWGFPR